MLGVLLILVLRAFYCIGRKMHKKAKRRWYYPEDDMPEGLEYYANDYIYRDKHGKLYFFDEIQVNCFGPYDTLGECRQGAESYGKSLG